MNRKILAFVSLVLALMLCMTGCTQQPAESADPTQAPAAGTDAPQALRCALQHLRQKQEAGEQ